MLSSAYVLLEPWKTTSIIPVLIHSLPDDAFDRAEIWIGSVACGFSEGDSFNVVEPAQ